MNRSLTKLFKNAHEGRCHAAALVHWRHENGHFSTVTSTVRKTKNKVINRSTHRFSPIPLNAQRILLFSWKFMPKIRTEALFYAKIIWRLPVLACPHLRNGRCLAFWLEVKNRNRNEEISCQMHVFANSRYLLALKNTFELPCDHMSFIYLKIQAANLRAHILRLNNENRNVNTNKFLT